MGKRRAMKHGFYGTTEYKAWSNIKTRCFNPKAIGYENYGGRGIKMCDRWTDFVNFYNDMGSKPSKKHSIERVDNDGDYCPENCKWALNDEQHRNRRNNVKMEYNGKILVFADIAKEVGIHPQTIKGRMKAGMSLEEAINKPIKYTKKCKI